MRKMILILMVALLAGCVHTVMHEATWDMTPARR